MTELISKIEQVKELTKELQFLSDQYYKFDAPVVSDKEYDAKFDELKKLEDETGFWMSTSPTRRVQGKLLDGFTKVTHSKPMLSAQKTKSKDEIMSWIGERDYYCSAKMDGCTVVLSYDNGYLTRAVTRGNGIVGEDITEQVRMIDNVPSRIPHEEHLELRGECLMTWDEFNAINESVLDPNQKYAHPRNLASGTLRNLDTSILLDRKLKIVIFECVTDVGIDDKVETLFLLSKMGFDVVPMAFETEKGIDACFEAITPDTCPYPMDGLIFELRSRVISERTGATEHHECCRIAYKFADETYPTTLRDIEWNTGRTGVVSPVAIFDTVNIDGSDVSRATLHNVSIIEDLKLGIGDTVEVYLSNMIIPAIDKNLTQSDTYKIPEYCPSCGEKLTLNVSDSGTKTLICENKSCPAQLKAKLSHYCSRDAMNIEGISDGIISKLVDNGIITKISDIYRLKDRNDLKQLDGFNEKLVKNIQKSIEKSEKTTMQRLIFALGIENIGKNAAKILANAFPSIEAFADAANSYYDFSVLDNIGPTLSDSIQAWAKGISSEEFNDIIKNLQIDAPQQSSGDALRGMIIVITGKLHSCTRKEMEDVIVDNGGKVGSSVTAKTTYLINNDTESNSSKNKKAKELGVQIISEEDFLKKIEKN